MEKKKNSLMMGMLVMFISAIMPAMAQTSAPLPSLVGVQPMKMEGATLLRGRMEQESEQSVSEQTKARADQEPAERGL